MQVSSVNVYISSPLTGGDFLSPKMPRLVLKLKVWCYRQMYRHRNKKRQHRRERENESDTGVEIFPAEKVDADFLWDRVPQ